MACAISHSWSVWHNLCAYFAEAVQRSAQPAGLPESKARCNGIWGHSRLRITLQNPSNLETCMAFMWFFRIGFMISFFIKLASSCQRAKLKPMHMEDLLWFIISLCAVQLWSIFVQAGCGSQVAWRPASASVTYLHNSSWYQVLGMQLAGSAHDSRPCFCSGAKHTTGIKGI